MKIKNAITTPNLSDRNHTDEHGRKQGHWTKEFADGTVGEGTYKDGKRHGHWVLLDAGASVQEGTYVDGEKHGHWVWRLVMAMGVKAPL